MGTCENKTLPLCDLEGEKLQHLPQNTESGHKGQAREQPRERDAIAPRQAVQMQPQLRRERAGRQADRAASSHPAQLHHSPLGGCSDVLWEAAMSKEEMFHFRMPSVLTAGTADAAETSCRRKLRTGPVAPNLHWGPQHDLRPLKRPSCSDHPWVQLSRHPACTGPMPFPPERKLASWRAGSGQVWGRKGHGCTGTAVTPNSKEAAQSQQGSTEAHPSERTGSSNQRERQWAKTRQALGHTRDVLEHISL